jgi:ABC-type transporter Mla MlaB component
MTFKIERAHSGQVTTLRLIGKLNSECLEELKQQVEHGGPQVMLDLAEVELVDVEVVRFLNACQSDGADIANGSRSIRAWMLRNGNQGCNHTIVDPPDTEEIAA